MENSFEPIRESALSLVSEGTSIEGKVTFDRVSRVHGTVKGEVRGTEGSMLILTETAVVEGSIDADTVMIDGYVQGDINARTKVVISRTGRVVGNVHAPSVKVEFGAYFEGKCTMDASEEGGGPGPAPVSPSGRALRPA